MNNRKRNRGISMLEVIIAFSITSILVAATMPNFQDYNIRARVVEGLRLAESAERALVDACLEDEQAQIRNNRDADYWYRRPSADRDYIDRIEISADCEKKNLSVIVWMIQTGASPEPIVQLTARVPDGVTSEGFEEPYYWNCRLIRGNFEHVPEVCRKRYRKS